MYRHNFGVFILAHFSHDNIHMRSVIVKRMMNIKLKV